MPVAFTFNSVRHSLFDRSHTRVVPVVPKIVVTPPPEEEIKENKKQCNTK